ncbi:MAG: matrixin family metalloprotease [Gemmatimonadota bacterium]
MKRTLPLLLLALGCSEILVPSRTPRYLSDLAGEVFRWPSDRLPVRYFADTRGNMPDLVRTSLHVWEAQFLYGEFAGTLVGDSTAADVIVVWEDSIPPEVPPDTAGALGACDGLTQFTVDSTAAMSPSDTAGTNAGGEPPLAMTGPIRVHLRVRLGYTEAQVAACMPRVAAHELGHTLGILTHSPATTDLMYGTPPTAIPTHRDRNTAQVLYHTTPTIGPPPR